MATEFENRSTAFIYANPIALDAGFEDFIAKNTQEILSINQRQLKVELRGGGKVYFYSYRSPMDEQKIMGMEFNTINVHTDVKEELHNYIRSRLRGTFNAQDHDDDITFFGDE